MNQRITTPEFALNIAALSYQLDSGTLPIPSELTETGWRLNADLDGTGFLDIATNGLKAIALTDGQGRIVIGFAGTEGIQDACSDIGLGWSQWDSARDFILPYLDQEDSSIKEIHFTGHSLGGALAQYAAYEFWLENGGSLRAARGPAASRSHGRLVGGLELAGR